MQIFLGRGGMCGSLAYPYLIDKLRLELTFRLRELWPCACINRGLQRNAGQAGLLRIGWVLPASRYGDLMRLPP
jgi:hypothetical protein